MTTPVKKTLMTAHDQWATRPADQRFQTLEQLRLAVDGRRMRSKAQDRSVNDLHVVVKSVGERKHLVLNDTILPTEPTHWSFGQLCGVAKAPASYLRTLSPELAADNLNYSIRRAPKDNFKLMTLTDPDGELNTLQAVTSTTYGRIWDCDVVDAVKRIVERSGGKFHNPLAYVKDGSGTEPSGLYASDHDVFMFMIDGGSRLEVGPRAQLNRGFIVWNSETGAKQLGIMTFLFNECCGNHIIMGASDIQTLLIRHNSGAPARFDREVTPVLAQYVNASAKPMEDAIRRAQTMPLSHVVPFLGTDKIDDTWVANFAKKFQLTRGEVKEAIGFAEREEGQCVSVWDMVQGLTASARGYEHLDTRLNLETRAGKLLEVTPVITV